MKKNLSSLLTILEETIGAFQVKNDLFCKLDILFPDFRNKWW